MAVIKKINKSTVLSCFYQLLPEIRKRLFNACQNSDRISKKVNLQWSQAQDDASKVPKQTLYSAPVLVNFDGLLPTYVTTDASQYTIGTVLEHEESNSTISVAFSTRTRNDAEQK